MRLLVQRGALSSETTVRVLRVMHGAGYVWIGDDGGRYYGLIEKRSDLRKLRDRLTKLLTRLDARETKRRAAAVARRVASAKALLDEVARG
mgnify:CR=1 FL=1